MNTVHIDTRETVNKSNLDEIQREAKKRQILRLANKEKNLESNTGHRRQNVFLMIKALLAWPTTLLHHRVSHVHSPHAMK